MHETILDATRRPEVRVGSPINVVVRRALASPRLGRVYLSGGRAVSVRTACGTASGAGGAESAGLDLPWKEWFDLGRSISGSDAASAGDPTGAGGGGSGQ